MPDRPVLPVVSLRAVGLSKRYGETTALDNVGISLGVNRVVGLVGENGAGKSTLLNVLSGIARPDAGQLEVHGTPMMLSSYAEAQRLGIARAFQELALIPSIPVYENLVLGCEEQFVRFGQILQRREMIRCATEMMEQAEARIDVRRMTSDLSFSERQLVEVIRACLAPKILFGVDCPIVMLDEPTASLEKSDEKIFFALLERIRRRGTVLFVSHRLTEVLFACDEIVVMKDGRQVAAVNPAETDERDLHQLMVGRERDADYYHEDEQLNTSASVVAYSVRGLARAGAYEDVTLEVKKGEILGIGGLLESGKSALGKGLAGIDKPDRGEASVAGDSWDAPDVRRLVAKGLGYVPAERLAEGMIASQPVTWNISLASGGDMFSNTMGVWRHRLEHEVSSMLIKKLGIKVHSPQSACDRLSGGNQQKVVLARWLARDLRVLILDNPTRGVDAGAKEEIYRLLRGLSQEGVAIVLITDELLELIGLSNRIAIMRQGRVRMVVDASTNAKPTEQDLIATMLSDGDVSTVREKAA